MCLYVLLYDYVFIVQWSLWYVIVCSVIFVCILRYDKYVMSMYKYCINLHKKLWFPKKKKKRSFKRTMNLNLYVQVWNDFKCKMILKEYRYSDWLTSSHLVNNECLSYNVGGIPYVLANS